MTLAAEMIRARGISVLIFPEGGRSRHGELRPFKDGAAFIGIKAGAPIVPVALIGTRAVLPFGSGHMHPGEVTLKIGEPIDTRELVLRDRGKITDDIRARITSMLGLESPTGISNIR
jgi:1-acyl-sn-glycerol-3-phosphate acyltransferase